MQPQCAERLIQSIQGIRNRLISSPLSDSLTKALESEQESLRLLLEQAALLENPEDRKSVKAVIDGFAQDLQGRLDSLQQQVANLGDTATQTYRNQQKIKAYYGSNKLF